MPNSEQYIGQALRNKSSGDGEFSKKIASWLEKQCNVTHALLTTSGSHALDMAAHLCHLSEGDEVIMSSFTFSSTANAFVGNNARIVFVDIRPDTMNINENLIIDAITDRTKVIVPMHYAGVACEMDYIQNIAQQFNLLIVEDAAHAILSEYKMKPLGSFGNFNCLSFHETKNFSMGEGGALLLSDPAKIQEAEIIREKGTDRSRFFRGEIDKYSWVDWGSSFLPSEINAAYLWSQLEVANEITNRRLQIWMHYYIALKPLEENGLIELPKHPVNCKHNAHLFYLKVINGEEQACLLNYLKNQGITAVFHYVPLHSSKAGKKFGRFHGNDIYTTIESQRLIRLPIWYGLNDSDIEYTISKIYSYYKICMKTLF